jgi:phage I-like protein
LRDLVLDAAPVQLGADGAPPSRFRIAAYGRNETTKGTFVLKPEDARAMVERAQKRGIKLSADYEHSAVHAAASGGEAPAAAWYDLEAGEDGLYAANVEWTPRAAERLKNREYRYHSPWFGQRDDGTVGTFKNFALTNRPAMDALEPLVATEDASHDAPPESPKMKTVFKTLALSEDATEAEVLTRVQALAAERDAFFTATGTKDMPSALAAVETAKRAAAELVGVKAKLDELTLTVGRRERELVLAEAIESGAIPPNMKDIWAGDTFTVEQLKAYVAKAPKTVKPAGAAGAADPAERNTADMDLALTEDDKAVARTLSISEADFAKQKKFILGRT